MPLSGDPETARTERFLSLPDPGQANSFGEIVEGLRRLKVWAGDPSYETIKERVNKARAAAGRPASELARRSTVAYCFRPGRRRLDTDLVLAVVQALHPDTGYVAQWGQALRVIGGETEAVSQVRVQDSLPQDLAGFTGRAGELDRLRRAAQRGEAVVISAIEGMAGVGKTQLAVHAGHQLHRQQPYEKVLFVNLRGFHPAQPPADPAAVLDGFLRLLGMPGHQIPHSLGARAAAYRDRLAGNRVLVVLDNAATAAQVRPLLPATPGCLALVTSRRRLADLDRAVHLSVDVLAPDEALTFLARALPGITAGADPGADARIVRRCGYLPLALSLITGHIRNTPGWTLTDHADRLDERHQQQRLDTGVELAFHLSYQHLPADQRRLLRLLALHPGQDFDAYAAAALTGAGLAATRTSMEHLHRDHLLQQAAPGRYALHDLVRSYATIRATDEDRPPDRHAALTRLFDHYLATTATAMNTLHPAEAHHRPAVSPAGTPAPDLADPDSARDWLDTERTTLVAVAAHTATHGWPAHTTQLSRILFRYLVGGHQTDAVIVYGHARHAARRIGDPTGQAHALADLGVAQARLGRYGSAGEHFQQALELFQQAGDPAGQARTVSNLGIIASRSGHYRAVADYCRRALTLYRQTSDRSGEARTLANLGYAEARLGRHRSAVEHHEQALAMNREADNQSGEADTLNGLGEVELRAGRYGRAGDHLRKALLLHRRHGNHTGAAWALDSLGTLCTRLGRPAQAAEHHRWALSTFRETGDRDGEAWALNGLGEAALAEGRTADALTHHGAARGTAADIGALDQQARALSGLGHTHRTLGDPTFSCENYRHALALYTELDLPEADQLRAHLAAVQASHRRA